MSKEREFLKKILATGWLNNELSCEVEKLLAQPEPFKPDWANYRQGVADSKREPIDTRRITLEMFSEGVDINYKDGYVAGIKWAERQHGIIGEDDE